MSENENASGDQKESELLRQIREGRKFSLSDAIGQMAGSDLMKGASPVTRKQQAAYEIEHFLERHLRDPEGALHTVFLRRIRESEIFLNHYNEPFVALGLLCERVLGSEHLLQALVGEIDTEWGRIHGERPYFETPGSPPHPDDPYTFASVRLVVTQLIEKLRSGDE
jgi:hypothetical protein